MPQGLAAPGWSQELPTEVSALAPHGLRGGAVSDWCSQWWERELGVSPWIRFHALKLSPSAAGIFLLQSLCLPSLLTLVTGSQNPPSPGCILLI